MSRKECLEHPGCIWSCPCDCLNCINFETVLLRQSRPEITYSSRPLPRLSCDRLERWRFMAFVLLRRAGFLPTLLRRTAPSPRRLNRNFRRKRHLARHQGRRWHHRVLRLMRYEEIGRVGTKSNTYSIPGSR